MKNKQVCERIHLNYRGALLQDGIPQRSYLFLFQITGESQLIWEYWNGGILLTDSGLKGVVLNMKPMCKICKLEVSKKVIELDNFSFLNEDEGQD